MERQPALFILANAPHGTLYIGVTGDLVGAIVLHRLGLVPGCTGRYHIDRLVYFERLGDFSAARRREKHIKDARRPCMLGLIDRFNPGWRDLWHDVVNRPGAPSPPPARSPPAAPWRAPRAAPETGPACADP